MTFHDYQVVYEGHSYRILWVDEDTADMRIIMTGEDISVGDTIAIYGGVRYVVDEIEQIDGDRYTLMLSLEDE